jgi:hypothetical protein
LRHWEGLQRAPETRDGYKAIKAFGDALSSAMPYIEWPFGKYERQDYRKRPRRKNWHLPAVLIAKLIERALIDSGRRKTSTTSGSTVVKVVREALIRMGYKIGSGQPGKIGTSASEREKGTIAAHLTSWKNSQALLAKQARLAVAKVRNS